MKATLTITIQDEQRFTERVVTVETDGVSMRRMDWMGTGFDLVKGALDEFEGQIEPTTDVEEGEDKETA